nr:hypothetical protein BaRGS_001872 [Batillaria attramentaria]
MINNKMVGLHGFAWASMFMSAIIASERCFCILFPLRSRSVLSTSTMAAMIIAAFLVLVGCYFVVAFRYDVICLFDPHTNSTTLQTVQTSEFYRENPELVNQVDSVMYGIVLIGSSPLSLP